MSSSRLFAGRPPKSPRSGFFQGTTYITRGNSRLPVIWVLSNSTRSVARAPLRALETAGPRVTVPAGTAVDPAADLDGAVAAGAVAARAGAAGGSAGAGAG